MKQVVILVMCLWALAPALSGMQQFEGQSNNMLSTDSMPCCDTPVQTPDSASPSNEQGNTAVATTSAKPAATKKAAFNLIGSWEHSLRSFDMATAAATSSAEYSTVYNATLLFTFKADGSYSKKLLNAPIKVEEYGAWQLTDDGNTLTLVSDNGDAPQVIKIKHLQMDELVLEHALRSAEANFCINQKDFFFNRR